MNLISFPAVMGILNVTPDSFYDGGRYFSVDEAVRRAGRILQDGGSIIDIGGESARPGSVPVSEQEEIDRVVPVVEAVVRELDAFVSVDTMKTRVAEESLKAGARMINDVNGLSADGMIEAISRHDAYAVICHMRGTPMTMQGDTEYRDVIGEVKNYLADRVLLSVSGGIKKEKIILDPGIGFGKTLEDNYRIIYSIKSFRELGYPVLIGLSRKSLVSKLLEKDEDTLPATMALNAVSIYNGAAVIRVHDVKEHSLMMKALKMLNRISENDSDFI